MPKNGASLGALANQLRVAVQDEIVSLQSQLREREQFLAAIPTWGNGRTPAHKRSSKPHKTTKTASKKNGAYDRAEITKAAIASLKAADKPLTVSEAAKSIAGEFRGAAKNPRFHVVVYHALAAAKREGAVKQSGKKWQVNA